MLSVIKQSKKLSTRVVGPVALNAVGAILVMGVIISQGRFIDAIDWSDFGIEFLSALTSYILFLIVCFLSITGRIRTGLLVGLSLIEYGRFLDALDEIILFEDNIWSVTGDTFTLIGEVVLAAAAIRFLYMTSQHANTDPLTQLYNRRYHEQAIEKLIHYNPAADPKFALIALDLDNFKAINDTHGHSAGDLALKHTAVNLLKCSRQQDVVSRVGGEEFELLVAVETLEQAMTVAERVRACMELTPPEGLTLLTASIGVAFYRPGESIESVRDRADQGVYASKRAGKNTVSVME